MEEARTPLCATLANKIITEDDLFKSVAERAGTSIPRVRSLHNMIMKEVKDIILTEPKTIIINLPKVGNLISNYKLTKAQLKFFTRRHRVNRKEVLRGRRELLMANRYKGKGFNNLACYRTPNVIKYYTKLKGEKPKDPYKDFYRAVEVSEKYSNERYEDFI